MSLLARLRGSWPRVSQHLCRAAIAAAVLTSLELLAFRLTAQLRSDAWSTGALLHAMFASYLLCASVGALLTAGLSRLALRVHFDRSLATLVVISALISAAGLRLFDVWMAQFSFEEFPGRLAWASGTARAAIIALVFFVVQIGWRWAEPGLNRHVPPALLRVGLWLVACIGCDWLIYETLAAVHLGRFIIPVAGGAVLAACFAVAEFRMIPQWWSSVIGNAALLLALVAPPTAFRNPYARFALFGHCPAVSYLMIPMLLAVDVDGDGSAPTWLGGDDCDNLDPGRAPMQREIPGDGIDQDCRGGDAPIPGPDPAWVDKNQLLAELGPCDLPPGPLSVVLLTVDALRADAVTPRITPNIVKFAAHALDFRRAYAPSTTTKRSFAAIFAGRTVSDFSAPNVFHNEDLEMGRPWSTTFAQAGYYTTGVNLLYTLPPIRNAFHRFNVIPNDDFQVEEAKYTIASATMTRAVLAQFQKGIRQPFLLWAHYPDAHAPYREASSAPQIPADLRGYEREVAYTDFHLGQLLQAFDKAGLYEHAMVVISADHGEERGQRGIEGHGSFAFESVVHVPLLIRIPGCPARQFTHPVSSVDLLANLATIAGFWSKARSLGATGERSRAVVTEVWPADPGFLRVVVDDTLKMIVDVRNGGRVLFDLAADPGERQDLYRSHPDLAARLEQRYQGWLDRPGLR